MVEQLTCNEQVVSSILTWGSMNKQEILHDGGGHLNNREVWYNTPDPDFIDICKKSMVQQSWISYQKVLSGKYGSAPVKPISNYVANIGYEPELVSISGNVVRLRVHLYADMFLLKKLDQDLYHVDRPWVRQYYLTSHQMDSREDCFDGTFKFYVPWAFDENVEVSYLSPEVDSPFVIQEAKDYWHKMPKYADSVRPHFVYFKFKKTGKHMVDKELGIPRRGDPIFDIVAEFDGIMLERIKEYYAKD